MKPLVYWCRWHGATLRLRGREPQIIWGELVYADYTEPFRFDLQQAILIRGEGESAITVLLDEMGIEVKPESLE